LTYRDPGEQDRTPTRRVPSPAPTPDLFTPAADADDHRDGATFEPEQDGARLAEQHQRVAAVMRGGLWRTLAEIAERTGYPEASVSARLRDFRKPRFGGYLVERRSLGGGLFAYRIDPTTRGTVTAPRKEFRP
jgi:hypothetical protein